LAIEERHEIKNVVRDARTVEQRVFAVLGSTPVSAGLVAACGIVMLVAPWSLHLLIVIAGFWALPVLSDFNRRVLPLFLPRAANQIDFNDRRPGARNGYNKANGISFLGNDSFEHMELWETKSFMTQHRLVLGTTGSGKTELLMGFLANSLLMGAGTIFGDAKGTKDQISKVYWLCRVFGREDDFFSINYITGGGPRSLGRTRLTNTTNPVGIASADQINQMFQSFLPEKGGDNQIFLERAIAMFSAITPAVCDLRDLSGEFIDISTIRSYASNPQSFLELAGNRDNRISKYSAGVMRNFLSAAMGINLEEFDAAPDPRSFKIPGEGLRTFTYASQYFVRALSSLTESYGHIYLTQRGEVSFRDAIYNRRIVLISLPALDKAPSELANIGKINIANIRAAVASAASGLLEGHRRDTIDILPTQSEFPTSITLDEYGYMGAPEGTSILMGQARSLNVNVTIAGQDFSNLKVNEREADAIYGNTVPFIMGIRNTSDIGNKVQESSGYSDVAVQSGLERDNAGPVYGYLNDKNVQIQRRYRLEPADLMSLNYGEAYILPGRNVRPIRYFPWAPLPQTSEYYQVNRFLPISSIDQAADEGLQSAIYLERALLNRREGASDPVDASFLGAVFASLLAAGREAGGTPLSTYIRAMTAAKPQAPRSVAPSTVDKAPTSALAAAAANRPGAPAGFSPAAPAAPAMAATLAAESTTRAPDPQAASPREIPPARPVVTERPASAQIPPPDPAAIADQIRARSSVDLFNPTSYFDDDPFNEAAIDIIGSQLDAIDNFETDSSEAGDAPARAPVIDALRQASVYQPPEPAPPPRDKAWITSRMREVWDRSGVKGGSASMRDGAL